jgi:hypothetical protein
MCRAYTLHGRDEKCIENFGLKSVGKRPHGRPRCRWENNIRMDLREGVGSCELD